MGVEVFHNIMVSWLEKITFSVTKGTHFADAEMGVKHLWT